MISDDDGDVAPLKAEWVLLVTVSSILHGEIMKQSLDDEEIPVLFRGNHSGLFGVGYQGPVAGGVQLFVPGPELEQAREILGLT